MADDAQDYQDYLEYQQHLAKSAPPTEPSVQETSIPGVGKGGIAGMLMDAMGGSSGAAARGMANTASLGNISPPQMKDDASQFPMSSMAGKAAGMGATMAATGAPVAAMESGLGRVGASAAANGLSGFLQKPSGEDTLEARGKDAGVGALIGAGAQGLGEGAGKAGDYLMQKAVGMRKYVPGMGTRIADEGLIGTKGMMARQADTGIQGHEKDLQSAVGQLQGNIEPESLADALRAKAGKYTPTPGESGPLPAPSENVKYINAAHDRADEALSRGTMTPTEGLDISRKVAKPAYNPLTGDELKGFQNELSQTEGGHIKSAIKQMGEDQDLPDVVNSLRGEEALYTAKKGLDRSTRLSDSPMGLAGSGLAGAVAGYSAPSGHKTEAALAAALAASPIGRSTAAQGLVKGSSLVPYLVPAISQKALSK